MNVATVHVRTNNKRQADVYQHESVYKMKTEYESVIVASMQHWVLEVAESSVFSVLFVFASIK